MENKNGLLRTQRFNFWDTTYFPFFDERYVCILYQLFYWDMLKLILINYISTKKQFAVYTEPWM